MVNARDHYVQPSDERWSAAPNFCLLPSWHGPSKSCGGAGAGVGGGQVPLGNLLSTGGCETLWSRLLRAGDLVGVSFCPAQSSPA